MKFNLSLTEKESCGDLERYVSSSSLFGDRNHKK